MWDLGSQGGSAEAPHEAMRLVEARLVRHVPGGSMSSKAPKHCIRQSKRDAPKVAILEARAPKMHLVEAQCAHRKHRSPKPHLGVIPLLGSHKFDLN